jgi:hypothetical protein
MELVTHLIGKGSRFYTYFCLILRPLEGVPKYPMAIRRAGTVAVGLVSTGLVATSTIIAPPEGSGARRSAEGNRLESP